MNKTTTWRLFSVALPNTPGTLDTLFGLVESVGANIVGITTNSSSRMGFASFVLDKPELEDKVLDILREKNYTTYARNVLAIDTLPNIPGAFRKFVSAPLGSAGINIEDVFTSVPPTGYSPRVYLTVSDQTKALEILEASLPSGDQITAAAPTPVGVAS